ncbi:MAG: hypothetical protein R3F56_25715 [Planctomycetota bacterium]
MAPRTLPLIVVLLVALAGGAAWLALSGDSASEITTVDDESESETDTAFAPSHLETSVDVSDDPGERLVDDADGEPVRAEVVSYPTDSDGPVLRVVDANGAPVAAAEVFAGDADGRWRNERGPDVHHWAQILERSTTGRRTDARGEVALPAIRRRLLVAGRAPGLFGAAVLRADEAQPVLQLVPDRTLRVLVRGGDGAPLPEVMVALCTDLRERLQRVSRATTDAAGIAELQHVQLFEARLPPPNPAPEAAQRVANLDVQRAEAALRQLRADFGNRGTGVSEVELVRVRTLVRETMMQYQQSRQRLDEARRQANQERSQTERLRRQRAPETQTWPFADFVVLAEVPQVQPSLLRFAAGSIPREVVELRLPTTSSLVVRVLGPDGEPLRTPCTVMLRLDAKSLAAGAAPANFADLCTMRADKALGADRVTFAPLGLGLTFDLFVRFADNDFNFQESGVAGPAGATAREIELHTPAWFTVLAGRLVDTQGRPCAGLETDLFVAGMQGRVEGEHLQPEADGRFELPLRLRTPAPPYTLEVQANRGERRFGRLIGLPELMHGKRTEIGDVELRELPILAQGTVRDDLGQPLARANVVVQVLRNETWTEESFVRDRTDAEGKFVLYGEPRPQRLRLVASLRRHSTDVRPIDFGAEVDLVLQRNGGILAAGVLPDFVPREAIAATLASADGGRPRDIQVRGRPNHGFELRVADLRPGVYDVTVRVRGLPRPLALAERVVVPPGETVRPATIDGLDLRGRLFAFTIRAVDQAGQAMNDPGSPLLVELHDNAGAPRLVPFSWRGGRVHLITDQPSVNVIGMASGHRPARALLQPGESTLRLTRLHPLVLELPGLRNLLGRDQAARISLVFQGDTGVPGTDVQAIDQSNGRNRGYQRAALGKAGGAVLGGEDRVSVALMFNGRYEIVLRIDGPGGRVSKTIGFVDAVLDGPQPMTATVSPDLGAARDALAELQALPPRKR